MRLKGQASKQPESSIDWTNKRCQERTSHLLLDDKRYFITSLDPDKVTPLDILRHIRNHWRIENSLHFRKDRWWDEDRHHTRRPGLSVMMAAINNAAISVHKILSDKSQPLRAAADYVQWSASIGIKMLAY